MVKKVILIEFVKIAETFLTRNKTINIFAMKNVINKIIIEKYKKKQNKKYELVCNECL